MKRSSQTEKKNVTVRAFSGATTDDIKDYCKPIAIVHTGTNDLKDSDELSIVENIVKVKEIIENISPATKTLISTLVNRYDSGELHHKALRVNEKLKQLLPAYDLIDNGNLDQSCVNKYGLHLSGKDTIHLAYNFNKYCLIIFNPSGTEHPCPSKKKKQLKHSMRKSQIECEREVKSRLIRNLGSSKRGLLICSLDAPSLRKHKDERTRSINEGKQK